MKPVGYSGLPEAKAEREMKRVSTKAERIYPNVERRKETQEGEVIDVEFSPVKNEKPAGTDPQIAKLAMLEFRKKVPDDRKGGKIDLTI